MVCNITWLLKLFIGKYMEWLCTLVHFIAKYVECLCSLVHFIDKYVEWLCTLLINVLNSYAL